MPFAASKGPRLRGRAERVLSLFRSQTEKVKRYHFNTQWNNKRGFKAALKGPGIENDALILLKIFGVTFIEASDAPRGGAEGRYVEVTRDDGNPLWNGQVHSHLNEYWAKHYFIAQYESMVQDQLKKSDSLSAVYSKIHQWIVSNERVVPSNWEDQLDGMVRRVADRYTECSLGIVEELKCFHDQVNKGWIQPSADEYVQKLIQAASFTKEDFLVWAECLGTLKTLQNKFFFRLCKVKSSIKNIEPLGWIIAADQFIKSKTIALCESNKRNLVNETIREELSLDVNLSKTLKNNLNWERVKDLLIQEDSFEVVCIKTMTENTTLLSELLWSNNKLKTELHKFAKRQKTMNQAIADELGIRIELNINQFCGQTVSSLFF